ncbi:MAG: flavodoxin domain-containing protein [Eubacteriales bacterium]|nr:flavodoxin domain-containing protein [Eubacteriales bacterium]
MNRSVVIYESKYGSTKRYAEWIAQALSCPLFERKKFRLKDLSQYEIIIYGGGLYAGGVSGIKLITQNWDILSGKKIVLFTCGIADPKDPDNISAIRTSLGKVLSKEMMDHLQLFHLRGKLDYSGLNLMHRSMMSMLRKMLLKKEPHTLREEDRLLLDTYGKCIDFTDPKSIQSLVAAVLSTLDSSSHN